MLLGSLAWASSPQFPPPSLHPRHCPLPRSSPIFLMLISSLPLLYRRCARIPPRAVTHPFLLITASRLSPRFRIPLVYPAKHFPFSGVGRVVGTFAKIRRSLTSCCGLP
jgi:hypothetical protein